MIILHCKKIKHNGYTEGEITKLGHSPPIWSSIPKNVQYINKLCNIFTIHHYNSTIQYFKISSIQEKLEFGISTST